MRFTPNARTFWITAGATLALLALVSSLAFLAVRYVRERSVVLAEAHRELARLEARRRELVAAERILELRSGELAQIERAFADPSAPLPFIEGIEDLGRRVGVRVELKLGDAPAGGRSSAYVVEARGAFRNVLTFLERMESLPFLTRIRAVEFRRSERPDPESPAGAAGTELTLAVETVAP